MKKLIIANWKSNKNIETAEKWLGEFSEQVELFSLDLSKLTVVIAPPSPLLATVFDAQIEHVLVGVQDLSPFSSGSYTGAVSVRNLQGLGVEYAIVGHSERRRHFSESHADVANKVVQAIDAGITPVVCIDDEYLTEQARAIDPEARKKCVVAYEPLEAIGSGDFQPPAEVEPIVARIKDEFGNVPVIYGGSVDEENVSDYLKIADGVLVGGASLKVKSFMGLIEQAL